MEQNLPTQQTYAPQNSESPAPEPVQAPPQQVSRKEAIAPAEAEPAEPEEIILSWSAPEFASTKKPTGWYLLLYGFFAILIAVAVFFKQWFSIILSVVMAIAITVFANRKPRNLVYSITNYGLNVGEKKYEFDQFNAFFVSDDYGQKVFDLIPVKRFEPMVSIPVSAEKSDDAEELLIQILPKVEPREDTIDKFFKFLRF